ncbi:MAG: methyltransferase domain-containing protein [Anaerolineae bacterium]|jgi:ubiquinone/menaquinone biosynthesis C-methylase UbiE|nr:methyltransferase domain-containing protein [Anaerolineae bacterium]
MAQPDRVRALYDRRARRYDTVVDPAWQERLRGDLFGRARGEVLEVGVGTGATFPHYPANLVSLTGLDVSEGMLELARGRAAPLPFPVRLQAADFQTLPFPAASFDTVTSSLALCGIPDPALLFSEIRRVLRPGGQLLALEHIRPPNPLLAALADLGDPLYDHFVGCHFNRRTPELLAQAGFAVTVVRRTFFGIGVALVAEPITNPDREAR